MLRNSQNTFFRCFILQGFYNFTIYDGLTSEEFLHFLQYFYNDLQFIFGLAEKGAEILQKKAINLRWFNYGY